MIGWLNNSTNVQDLLERDVLTITSPVTPSFEWLHRPPLKIFTLFLMSFLMTRIDVHRCPQDTYKYDLNRTGRKYFRSCLMFRKSSGIFSIGHNHYLLDCMLGFQLIYWAHTPADTHRLHHCWLCTNFCSEIKHPQTYPIEKHLTWLIIKFLQFSHFYVLCTVKSIIEFRRMLRLCYCR